MVRATFPPHQTLFLAVFRGILYHIWIKNRYSAEEVGLRGSAAIAASYKSNGVSVKGMMQMDMTA